jgi:hypothetical protein
VSVDDVVLAISLDARDDDRGDQAGQVGIRSEAIGARLWTPSQGWFARDSCRRRVLNEAIRCGVEVK